MCKKHDDVIKWKHFPRYWPFVRVIHRSPVNSPHKGQWRGALIFSLIFARINGWVNNGKAGDLRRNHAHYHVTVMFTHFLDWHIEAETILPLFRGILLNKGWMKFVPKARVNNITALVQIMAWRRPGDNPVSEPVIYWRIYAPLGPNELIQHSKCCWMWLNLSHVSRA